MKTYRTTFLRFLPAGRGAVVLGLFLSAPLSAQVTFAVVEKLHDYQQLDATTVVESSFIGPWTFGAFVEGEGLSGISAPVFTPAPGSSASGQSLVYDNGDDAWGFEAGFSTKSEMDAAYVNGLQALSLSGVDFTYDFEFDLSGDLYPNAPQVTASVGAWDNGTLTISTSDMLTLTSNVFAAYTSNENGYMEISFFGENFGANQDKLASEDNAGSDIALTIDGSQLTAGQFYEVELIFASFVDADTSVVGLLAGAVYSAGTSFTVYVIPEASTSSLLAALGALGFAAGRRRRARD